MRELVAELIDRRVSRRGFIERLAAAGLGVRAIEAVLADVDGSGIAAASPPDEVYRSVTGTGGELLVEQIRAAGVEFVFANPGTTEVGFYDALVDPPGLQLIVGLHEGVVVAMADGYYQATGKPVFVNVHALAGTAQMGGQLYNAHWDNVPMVVTAGQPDPTIFSDDMPLAGRQGFDQADVNRQFTKISWSVRNPASIPLAVRRAFKVAATPPGGPVYLGFAPYALNARDVTADIIDQDRFAVPMQVRPDSGQVDQAARWLLEAARPFVMIGKHTLRGPASDRAVELADLLGVPVMDNLAGFRDLDSGFPSQHALHYDGAALALWRRGAGENPLDGCDLLVGLGMENFQGATISVGAGEGGGARPWLSRTARKVAIGLDATNMARTEPVDLPVVADVAAALADLLAAVRSLATADRLAKIRAARVDRMSAEIAAFRRRAEADVRSTAGRQPMHPDEVSAIVDGALDADAVTVHENYSHDSRSLSRVLQHYGPGGRLRVASTGGSLGWGVGAAIGAKLGQPDRQVALFIGDGALMYSASGFWTMARYRVPVLTIVWNNLNYQIVRFGYDAYGGRMAREGKFPGLYLGDPDIDFTMLARSQGVRGERATTAAELRSALDRGIAATRSGEPYLIDVAVDRTGAGAESTWHQQFSLADRRERKV